jgi:hypothetical protein
MFAWSCALFTIWNLVVTTVSHSTGWWGPGQPNLHFTVSAVVTSIPLWLAAALWGRRRG